MGCNPFCKMAPNAGEIRDVADCPLCVVPVMAKKAVASKAYRSLLLLINPFANSGAVNGENLAGSRPVI